MRYNECKPCTCLKRETFSGTSSASASNNTKVTIQKPLAYFRKLHKELNDGIAKYGRTGRYTATIRVNPLDKRSFLSAEFRYGRRVLKYTNVATLPKPRTNKRRYK